VTGKVESYEIVHTSAPTAPTTLDGPRLRYACVVDLQECHVVVMLVADADCDTGSVFSICFLSSSLSRSALRTSGKAAKSLKS
jgi:hypothetical protein